MKKKRLESPTAIRLFETDVEKLEQEEADVTVRRNKKEAEQFDIEVAINEVKYLIEHPKEFIFSCPIFNRRFPFCSFCLRYKFFMIHQNNRSFSS